MSRRPRWLPVRARPLLAAAFLIPAGAAAQARWTIEENLRIGTLDEGPASFADIRGVAVGAEGTIWVLDFKTQEIRMFDAQGKFLRRVARVGSGPGEIRNANGMLTAPNGDIWVNDPSNGRFSVFTAAGDFRAQYLVQQWGYGYLWDAMIDRDGRLNEFVSVHHPDGRREAAVRTINANGATQDTLALPSCPPATLDTARMTFVARASRGSMMMGVPFQPRSVMAWDPRGAVWCSGGDRYEVLRIALGSGDTTVRIRRDVPAPAVTRAERDSVIALVRGAFAKYGAPDPDFSWIPKTKPVIVAVNADDAGRVWVQSERSDRTRTMFDVWNDAGQLVATAVAPFRISPYWHPLFRGDTVYAVTTDADDVPYVVRALIRRPAQP